MKKILKYKISGDDNTSSYSVTIHNSTALPLRITIKNNCYANYVEKNIFLWKRHAKKRRRQFLAAIIFSLSMLMLSLFFLHRSVSPYGGFVLGIALTWLIFTANYASSIATQKEKLIQRCKKISDHMSHYGIETETIINNEKIFFRDAETYTEFGWKRFTFFEFTSEFLVLTPATTVYGSFFIDTVEMSLEEKSILKNFLEKNLRPFKN